MKKSMITFCILLYAFVVPCLEINDTHVFNPDWTPHVRIHEVWQLITNTGIGILCLWLVWIKKEAKISAILSLLVTGGFLLAYALKGLYGGSMVYLDGSEKTLLGINIGVLGFGVAFILLLFTIPVSKKLKYLKKTSIFLIMLVVYTSCQNSEKSRTPFYMIAYSSQESDNRDIYLNDTNGESKIKITDHTESDGYPDGSPDGKRMTFYGKYDEGKTWSIHTINIDGTNRKRLTNAKNKWDSSPSWSPNGKKIAFAREYKDTGGIWQEEIWIMNSDGSAQRQIKPLKGGGPFFMQDGRILFHSKSKFSEICIANSDGSNIIVLTQNNAEDWYPEVSPDGKQIAYMSNRDGNREIYIMDIDGSNQKRLTFNDVDDWYPSWSPDGSKLIFSSENTEEYFDIYMMNKDGSSVKKIIDNGSQPTWLKPNK